MADVLDCRCGSCTRLGFNCDYDSVWRPPITQINKPCRRRHPHRTLKSYWPLHDISKLHIAPDLDSESNDDSLEPTHLGFGYEQSGFEWKDSSSCEWLSPFSFATLYPNPTESPDILSNVDGARYLSYYVGHLSRLLVMADTASNPLRETIIPRLAHSPTLFRAVCAVSACHLSQRSDNDNASRDAMCALKYYSQALTSLTSTLTEYTRSDRDLADVTVLTAAFLCKYEIIRGSIREWRLHLVGLMQLVNKLLVSVDITKDARKFLQSL